MKRTQRPRWRVAAAVLAVVVLFAAPPPARAENGEIEIRLKTAGVPPRLRTRIHAAIERGIEFVLEQQLKNGVIRGPHGRFGQHDVAYTTIAGLALAHSGGSKARRGADRAIDWLIDEKGGARMTAMSRTYEIGLLAMLLKARMRHPDVAKQIVGQITRGLDRGTSWWGYRVGSVERGTAFIDAGSRGPNLSTTQFAALGLWAAAKAGGYTPHGTWRAHLRSLLDAQKESGSFGYTVNSSAWISLASGYPTGTCMGVANLVLAGGALEEDLLYDPVLAARTQIALRRGRGALDIAARAILGDGSPKMPLGFYYYSMYAMEKACVFTEVDELNGLMWYVTGAQQLLALQHKSGGWGSGPTSLTRSGFKPRGEEDILATSFALLFLLRASEVYRPTTPRGVPTPPAAVTGGKRTTAPTRTPSRGSEPPKHVTVSAATAQADRVWQLLKKGSPGTSDLTRAIERLAHTQTVLVPNRDLDTPTPEQQAADGQAIAAVRERIERALLKTFTQFGGWSTGDSERAAVAAAKGLALSRPAAVRRFRDKLSGMLRGSPSDFPSMARLNAAMRTIGVAGTAKGLKWMEDRVTTQQDQRSVRLSRAALSGLGALRAAPGRERFAAFRALVKRLLPVERVANDLGDELEELTAQLHWRALSAPAVFALAALSRDPITGDEPTLTSGMPPMSVAEYATWFEAHDNVRAGPWSEAE